MFDFFSDVIEWFSSVSDLINFFVSSLRTILSIASSVVSWITNSITSFPDWIATLLLFFIALLLLFFALGR